MDGWSCDSDARCGKSGWDGVVICAKKGRMEWMDWMRDKIHSDSSTLGRETVAVVLLFCFLFLASFCCFFPSFGFLSASCALLSSPRSIDPSADRFIGHTVVGKATRSLMLSETKRDEVEDVDVQMRRADKKEGIQERSTHVDSAKAATSSRPPLHSSPHCPASSAVPPVPPDSCHPALDSAPHHRHPERKDAATKGVVGPEALLLRGGGGGCLLLRLVAGSAFRHSRLADGRIERGEEGV